VKEMKASRENFSSGFTVLELLIVLSIVSVISAFSFPCLLGWQASFLGKLTAQRIASELRLAKIEALRTGVTTQIIFDPVQDFFTYQGCTSKRVNFPKGVDLCTTNFSRHTILFYPTGTPSMGGTVTIRINEKLLHLIITPVTGRVRISEK